MQNPPSLLLYPAVCPILRLLPENSYLIIKTYDICLFSIHDLLMRHLPGCMIFSIIRKLNYGYVLHSGGSSFWVMTRVRKPYLARSEHAYVMKSESIDDILGYITVSAPFRYNIILPEPLSRTTIPILLLSDVNGNTTST